MVGKRAKRGFLNEAADDIQAITGVKRNAARDLARGNKAALKELTAGKRRRVERVGAERASRLHQLELTRRKLKKSVAAFEKDILDNGIPKLQKRLDSRKAESEAGTQAGQVRAMPGGGVIQPISSISS